MATGDDSKCVLNLKMSLDFYRSKLGFEIMYTGGGSGQGNDFWAIVRRDGAMLMLKHITPEIHPQPNHSVTSGRAGMLTLILLIQTCCMKST
jgi:catechol 2,3-dioxygenase-like lactoylglutathione lyase family enzyme